MNADGLTIAAVFSVAEKCVFVAVGTREDVRQALAALVREFARH